MTPLLLTRWDNPHGFLHRRTAGPDEPGEYLDLAVELLPSPPCSGPDTGSG